jgi:hypothetical protein
MKKNLSNHIPVHPWLKSLRISGSWRGAFQSNGVHDEAIGTLPVKTFFFGKETVKF